MKRSQLAADGALFESCSCFVMTADPPFSDTDRRRGACAVGQRPSTPGADRDGVDMVAAGDSAVAQMPLTPGSVALLRGAMAGDRDGRDTVAAGDGAVAKRRGNGPVPPPPPGVSSASLRHNKWRRLTDKKMRRLIPPHTPKQRERLTAEKWKRFTCPPSQKKIKALDGCVMMRFTPPPTAKQMEALDGRVKHLWMRLERR